MPTQSPTTTPPTAAPTSQPTGPIDPAELTGRITFAHDDGVWTANADGSNRFQVTSDGGFDPSWSPDGAHIVYRKLLAEDDGEIWIVNPDGSNARNLVNDPDFSDWGPAWSPDGQSVAYDSNREVGLAIWLMDADGSNQRVIGTGHGEYPAWSPDGMQIVYAGGSYYDIWLMNADGSNVHELTDQPAYDMGPAWSPDGQWIAYHTQVDHYPDVVESGMGVEMEIHLVRPDGTDDHAITDDLHDDSFAAWSPNGQFLMWARDGRLVVTRADGSGLIDIGNGNFPSWIR
jgi:Tol biopolymer transport system component